MKEQTNNNQIINNLIEIKGLLRTLSEEESQSYITKKRAMELNKFIGELLK